MKTWTTTDEAWADWPLAQRKAHRVRIYRLADGRFVGLPGITPIPEGAQILEPQPKPPPSGKPNDATQEAMSTLESKYPYEVRLGCYWAVRIARERLSVHSKALWDRLVDEKLMDPIESSSRWLGAVFHRLQREKILIKTAQVYKYVDKERGVHERTIPIWSLANDADIARYDVPPVKES